MTPDIMLRAQLDDCEMRLSLALESARSRQERLDYLEAALISARLAMKPFLDLSAPTCIEERHFAALSEWNKFYEDSQS